ncbi:MAG TPA: hypothetical protein VHW46_13070 [Terracidiphilus sp.]|jgi:hypothetical protein|nr:hypothetical protein [Terracidiphilus sp.]
MKLIRWAAMGLVLGIAAIAVPAQKPSPWDQPAVALADQIAGILGPGQAHLTLRNLSSISTDALPVIRTLLEIDLKARGITLSGDEGANTIRVTLSENMNERVWVAEVVEGGTTQVALVEAGPAVQQHAAATSGLTLRTQVILTSRHPVLAALETPGGWIVLEPDQLVFYLRATDGLHAQSRVDIDTRRSLPRDPRGLLRIDTSQTQLNAWLAGTQCAGPTAPSQPPGDWGVSCQSSDDPWPVFQDSTASAFYNSARNYFTGVVTPSVGADLPAFYSAAAIPRAAGGAALVVASVDGKVLLLENNTLKAIAGTRDWGSDVVVLRSGCGSGAQIIASSSGDAADSLRAYELPALEALPASAPLEISGTVTALWAAADSRSVLAVVQRAPNQYEVDRVSALCN